MSVKQISRRRESRRRESRQRESRRRSAFTLMEILLVLAILVVLGSLSVFAFRDTLFASKMDTAKVQIGAWKIPLQKYLLDYNRYPQTLEELANPTNNDNSGKKQTIYLEKQKIPLDPWGNPYQYEPEGTKNRSGYDLFSTGPDGQAGTNDDIGNWE